MSTVTPIRLLVALAAALPRLTAAQLLTGTVRDSATRGTVPGVVVTLGDSAGRTLTRTLTDERGVYRIAWSPRAREVRAQRMGFRPRVVPAPATPDVAVSFAMVALPTLLEPMTSRAPEQCADRGDARVAFALWEQARTALLATVVAREVAPLDVRLETFFRVYGDERAGVLSQLVHAESATSAKPFVAVAPAATLVRDGFRTVRGDVREFFAPDAEVLLDDAFVGGYCLRLARGERSRPGEVGLAFRPARTRRGRVDIEGTVWVDTAARALTDLEFRYRGLDDPRERALDPGGEIGFATMPNGATLVARWALRLAAMAALRDPRETGLQTHAVGGDVVEARLPGGRAWHAALGAVRGRLVSRGVPVAGAELRLVGTPYRARTDASGAFELRDLLPGPYTIALADSALNEAGFERTRGQSVTVARDAVADVEVELPGDDDVVAALCGRRRAERISIPVRVLLPNGAPAPGARVWVEIPSPVPGAAGTMVLSDTTFAPRMFYRAHDGPLGVGGTFVACNLQALPRYVVHAALGDAVATATVDVAGLVRRPLYPVLLRLVPR